MNRQTVDSSQIRSVGYDEAAKTLEVEFTTGGIYQYADVPKEKHAAFLSSDSKGRYLAMHIKQHHKFTKL